MTLLSRAELNALITKENGPYVSIFAPMQRAGPDTRINPIRFKNLVTEAQEQLVATGLRAPEARRLLEPAQELIDNYDFWQHQSDGLAIFLSSDLFRTYRLPLDLKTLVLVSDRFHLKPLLPLLSGDGRFYVLALSQNEVRLLLGARYQITTIDLEDVPESLAEALRFDDPEKQQQFHTATASSGTPGGRPAVFHGHGVSSDDKQSNLLRYFQQIDRGLQSLLPYDEPVPLVLAGVEYLLPIYHDANHYPYLMDQGVTGNPEEMSPAELHERAWAIVHPHFEQSRQEARARYEQLANTDQASGDIRTILPAAHYGRVDTLFVALGRQQWGRFDPDTNTIQLRAEPEPEDEDLLNTAAIQTMSNGGTVFAVEPDDMPDQLPLAAIFRYKSSPDTTGAYE